MLKGAQKRMIVIKTADSGVFDEAYFLVKPNFDGEEMDMIAEADRIASGVIGNSGGEKKRKKGNEWLCQICNEWVTYLALRHILFLQNRTHDKFGFCFI